jgi:aminopeptidase N
MSASPLHPFRHPRRRVAVLCVGLAVVVAFGLAATMWLTSDSAGTAGSTGRVVADEPEVLVGDPPGLTPADDAVGLGDPYDPGAGGAGYDALSYDATLTVDPATVRFEGQATVRVTLTDDIDTVHLDLGLRAGAVTIGGAPAEFTQTGLDLAVATGGAAVGDTLAIGVTYAGIPQLDSTMGESVIHDGEEILIADEPIGTSTWLPVNGHPRDPATFRATFSVPAGVEAISVGRLVDHGPDPADSGRDLWTWQTDEPAVPYAIMVAIGQYKLDIREEVTAGGRTVQYVAAATESSRRDPDKTLEWLAQSIDAVDALSEYAGEYPFSALGGVVPPFSTFFGALETHGRPVYGQTQSTAILTHELAHQWFGDKVTLYEWNDIVNNEGVATYCEYLAPIASTWSPDTFFDSTVSSNNPEIWTQVLSDPGPGEATFSGEVYGIGGAAVHALRTRMGDEAFFEFFRAWAAQTGPRSLEDWRAMAQEYSPVDVTGLFAAWLDGTTAPEATAENGFPETE